MKLKEKASIIGIDPGINNLGWCVTSTEGAPIQWGLLTSTLVDLKKPEDIKLFKRNMKVLIKTLNSYHKASNSIDFIMERYMPRGMRRGNQTERMNIIIGYLLGKVKYSNVFLVPASAWKNRREKEYYTIDNPTIPDHITDTYTMTLYYLERLKNRLKTSSVRKLLRIIDRTEYDWKKVKGVWVRNT